MGILYTNIGRCPKKEISLIMHLDCLKSFKKILLNGLTWIVAADIQYLYPRMSYSKSKIS